MSDAVVFFDPDGRHYLATIDGQWWRWPAERGGWARREPCKEHEGYEEAPPTLARLALLMTGARGDG
jgi:hypothetical protein